ncbi:hypothetical protein ANO14919_137710 [Xylariales sp. No.14919]|nr:hypothetical protein ANO14919_137710 [Xylariales sp. No.14919]
MYHCRRSRKWVEQTTRAHPMPETFRGFGGDGDSDWDEVLSFCFSGWRASFGIVADKFEIGFIFRTFSL